MKTIDIIGGNYFGYYDKTRTACRGIVIRDGKILLSHETRIDRWMIPGGGLEEGESEEECVIRELAEETGYLIRPSECILEVDEHYEDWKYPSRYFLAEVCGETAQKLTDVEIKIGLRPEWIPVSECLEIFSGYEKYEESDEVRHGIYLREYTALKELLIRNMKIRSFREDDLDDLCELLSDKEVMAHLEAPFSRERTKRFLKENGLVDPPRIQAVEDGMGRFIGYVIRHPYEEDSTEIGWVLKKDVWGQGITRELTKRLIEEIHETGKTVIIECSPKQEVTKHIAEAYGFTRVGQRDGCDVYALKPEDKK